MERKGDEGGLHPCAWGHGLLQDMQMHFEGKGWTFLFNSTFDLGEGKSLYLERKEMSLRTLTWREGCVLAPVPVPGPVWILQGGEPWGE